MQSYNWMLFLGVGFIDPKLRDTFIGTFFYVTRRKRIKLIRYVYLNVEKIWAMWRIFGHTGASHQFSHVWAAENFIFRKGKCFIDQIAFVQGISIRTSTEKAVKTSAFYNSFFMPSLNAKQVFRKKWYILKFNLWERTKLQSFFTTLLDNFLNFNLFLRGLYFWREEWWNNLGWL